MIVKGLLIDIWLVYASSKMVQSEVPLQAPPNKMILFLFLVATKAFEMIFKDLMIDIWLLYVSSEIVLSEVPLQAPHLRLSFLNFWWPLWLLR
jgi:hypothetical protein